MIIRRYFQITESESRLPTTYVEYFGDFATWVYRNCIYRWEYVDRSKNIYWFICSNLVVDYHHVVNDLKNRKIDVWTPVNLEAASNPKHLRKPAMNRKGKK